MLRVQIALLYLSLIRVNSDEQMPRIKTNMGELIGYYRRSQYNRPYEAYEGIPYALPPVGKLRFMPPQPLKRWIGILSATSFGNECIQFMRTADNYMFINGVEDCLYLNIYVPTRNEINATLMPVLFWIHDGFFQFGSGMRTSATNLMNRDVIVVTFNYRLGPFGFLSTEDEVVPGNMGLKDQSMALRWISENIERFGGDKKRITLVGLDAGGASVHYHYLSPWSAGLFQGGISISGTAFNCWAQTENALWITKKLSSYMKCPTTTNTSENMIRCLQHHPIENFKYAVKKLKKFLKNVIVPFGPVIEKFGNKPFIDRTPIEIMHSRDVQDIPWIIGMANPEGFYAFSENIIDYNAIRNTDDWYASAPSLLDFKYTIPKEDHIRISDLIKKYYSTGDLLEEDQIMEIISDRLFLVDSAKAARMQAKVNRNPVWFYFYTYTAKRSMCNSYLRFLTCHGDDAFTVMDVPWLNPRTSRKDRTMQQDLINLWVSFATDKVPKIGMAKWERVDPSRKEFQFLHIYYPRFPRMESHNNFGRKELWNFIKFNENKVKSKSINRTKEEL